jgi:Cu(I)/Ag(I) efflux system periplasmic protein CusF
MLAILGIVAATSAQAQGMHHDHGAGHAHGIQEQAAADPSELPQVEGEVRRVNTRANTLSLRHGDIPNLGMPPMTMVFQVGDAGLLEGLQVGDRVLVTIDQIDGAYTVLSIQPAP